MEIDNGYSPDPRPADTDDQAMFDAAFRGADRHAPKRRNHKEDAAPEKPLDELQVEAEKLVALLQDRQEGLMSWHSFLRDRVQKIHELTSRMLGR